MNLLIRPKAEEAMCLLKAAFLNGEDAHTAWQHWCEIGDFDDLPPGAYTLFPRLYASLGRMNVEHPFKERLKGVQRKVWYQNQLHMQRYEQVLRLAQKYPDPLVLIYGLHAWNEEYSNSLLPVRQLRLWAGEALAVYLSEQAPRQIPSLSKQIISAKRQSWKLTDRAGLDLYFYTIPPTTHLPQQPAPQDIMTARVGDTSNKRLVLPLQTLWAVLEVTRGRGTFPTTALTELLTLLEQIDATSQWDMLLDGARRYQRIPHLQATLRFIRQNLSTRFVPDPIFENAMRHTGGFAATWHYGHWYRLPSDRPFVYRVHRRLHRAIKKGA